MVMIPKAEQYKWRLIAILVTPYRVWARKNGETVSSWMKGLQRDWIANGPGKAAEQAANDIALNNESLTTDDNEVAVTMLADLEKGFEKVTHSLIEANAAIYNFPPKIWKCAVAMYKAARRIRCGRALSTAVFSKIGVLAGCPIAMGLLLLSVLDPMDQF